MNTPLLDSLSKHVDAPIKLENEELKGTPRSTSVFGRILDWIRRTPAQSQAYKSSTQTFLNELKTKYPMVNFEEYLKQLADHLTEDFAGRVKPLTSSRAKTIMEKVRKQAETMKSEADKEITSKQFGPLVKKQIEERLRNNQNNWKQINANSPNLPTEPSKNVLNKITTEVKQILIKRVNNGEIGVQDLNDAIDSAVLNSATFKKYEESLTKGAYAIKRLPGGDELLEELNKQDNKPLAQEFLERLTTQKGDVDELTRDFMNKNALKFCPTDYRNKVKELISKERQIEPSDRIVDLVIKAIWPGDLNISYLNSATFEKYEKSVIEGAYAIQRLPGGDKLLEELNKPENHPRAKEFLERLTTHEGDVDELTRDFMNKHALKFCPTDYRNKVKDLISSKMQIEPSDRIVDLVIKAIWPGDLNISYLQKAWEVGLIAILSLQNGKELLNLLEQNRKESKAEEFIYALLLQGERMELNAVQVAQEFQNWLKNESNAFGKINEDEFGQKLIGVEQPENLPRASNWKAGQNIQTSFGDFLTDSAKKLSSKELIVNQHSTFFKDFDRNFKPVIKDINEKTNVNGEVDKKEEFLTNLKKLCTEALSHNLENNKEPESTAVNLLGTQLLDMMHQGIVADVLTHLQKQQDFPPIVFGGGDNVDPTIILKHNNGKIVMEITASFGENDSSPIKNPSFQKIDGEQTSLFQLKGSYKTSGKIQFSLEFKPNAEGRCSVTCQSLSGEWKIGNVLPNQVRDN